MLNCATVQKVIAEAARAGDLRRLPPDVRSHLDDCPECADPYFDRLEMWACSDVRACVEHRAIKSPGELPDSARIHVEHCEACRALLAQDERLDRMLSNVTLAPAGVSCPSVKPEMLHWPMTWKLALALTVAVLSLGAVALSMYRTAERWGWLYEAGPAPVMHCGDCPDCGTEGHQAAVK